jgi:hypothetical protein
LVEAGYAVTLLDDLSNTHEQVFVRLQELAGGRSGALSFVKVSVAVSCKKRRNKKLAIPVHAPSSKQSRSFIHTEAHSEQGEEAN